MAERMIYSNSCESAEQAQVKVACPAASGKMGGTNPMAIFSSTRFAKLNHCFSVLTVL